MKKLLFALVAIFATLSISAQVIEIYKNNVLHKVFTNSAAEKYKAIFKETSFIAGEFSVSATKKVRFTKGNLWWDGIEYHLEKKQTDYPKSPWDANHVGHFFWTNSTDYSSAETAKMPYALSYSCGTRTAEDLFWCGVDNKISADGQSGLYTLSMAEWTYLLKERDDADDKQADGVTVDNIEGCTIIAPDGFTGVIAEEYTLQEVDAAGFLCLPPAGYRYNNTSLSGGGDNCYYWSSTPNNTNDTRAQGLNISGSTRLNRANGYAIRLVQDIETGGDEPGDEPGDDPDPTFGGKLLPGEFSVSDTKKVKITKSNIYWDGSNYHFEEKAIDFPTAWDSEHVGHFFFTDNNTDSRILNLGDANTTMCDLWCDENHKQEVDGISDLYVLSKEEWLYLVNSSQNKNSIRYNLTKGVNIIDGTKTISCLIIAPDNYQDLLKDSYTLDEAITKGFAILPRTGIRNRTSGNLWANHNGSSASETSNWGYYWSSTNNPDSYNRQPYQSYTLYITQNYGSTTSYPNKQAVPNNYGCAIRLVKDI